LSLINNLTQIDFLILVVTIISMFYGYIRGLIKEILSILSIFFSGYISTILYPEISLFIKEYIDMAILADGISFVVLFILIYSIISILSNLIITSIYNTPIKIFDKNFGIIFGFFRSLLIFSILNILLVWIFWKNTIPTYISEAKSMILINYTSRKILDILPKNSLLKIKSIFGVESDIEIKKIIINKKNIEKYSEPVIDNTSKKNRGYSADDNDSLNKLFNIENNE
jgi:membrane protein required for colicin V production